MKKCPKCGGEDFEVAAICRDIVMFLVGVDDVGTFETHQTLKEYRGDTAFSDTVECYTCGCKIGVEKWQIVT